MQKQSPLKQLSLVLFDPQIGPNQVLPLWTRVNLGAMAMKGFSAFLKVPALLEPHPQIFYLYAGQSLRVGG